MSMGVGGGVDGVVVAILMGVGVEVLTVLVVLEGVVAGLVVIVVGGAVVVMVGGIVMVDVAMVRLVVDGICIGGGGGMVVLL